MRISTTTSLYRGEQGQPQPTMLECTQHLIETGFDALDMNLHRYKFVDEWRSDIEKSVEYAEMRGVKFYYGHLPYNFPKIFTSDNKSEFDIRLYRAIDAAVIAGLTYAVMHAYTIPVPVENYDEENEQKKAIEMLSPYYEYADKHGCEIVIENMRNPSPGQPVKRYLSELSELSRLCDALGGRGVCLDTGHAHTVGQDTPERIALLGTRLKMLHINDNFAAGDDHLPPFFGSIDWQSVMKGIKMAGYSGCLNYEVISPRVPPTLRLQHEKFLLNAARVLIHYYNEASFD